ncbi:MAG: hypothetical protein ACK40O_08165 [Allosphingosinicella sp.]
MSGRGGFGLVAIVALAQACAPGESRPGGAGGAEPHLLVASPESRIGGEALLEGRLRIVDNCLVVSSSGPDVLPIFDSSVTLDGSGRAILDTATGERIRIGGRLRGSAAYLRDSPGAGWTDADIARFTGASVPAGCGGRVARLRSIRAPGS